MNIETLDKIYKREKNSYYSCQYVISFCTKYKRKIISSEMKEDLSTIFYNIATEFDFVIKDLYILENQVILIIDCNPNFGISKVINKLKNISATKLKEKYPFLESRIPSIWTREEFISTMGNIELKDINIFVNMQNKQ